MFMLSLAFFHNFNPDDPQTINRKRTEVATSFLATRQISKSIRETFKPRFAWRPYVLRVYFDIQLLITESKGKIANDIRAFFMGHSGNIKARYTTNKGILPGSQIQRCMIHTRDLNHFWIRTYKRRSHHKAKGSGAKHNTTGYAQTAWHDTRDVPETKHKMCQARWFYVHLSPILL